MTLRHRFEVIAATPTRGVAERAVLLAALQWAGKDGVLWPSLPNWAHTAGMDPRALRRIVRRLSNRGVLRELSPSTGGFSKATARYQILALASPDRESGVNPGPRVPPPRTAGAPTPDPECPHPGPGVRQTTKNNQENNHEQAAAVDVLSQLGIENLRGHPNATPERVAWIAREAPGKDNPGGWAAECIRKGWAVPASNEADAKAAGKAAREATLARFDALPEAERAAVLAAVRTDYPNLASQADDSPGVRGAVARVLGSRSGRRAPAGGAA